VQKTSIQMLERLAFNAVKDRLGFKTHHDFSPQKSTLPEDKDIPHIVRFVYSLEVKHPSEIVLAFRVVDSGENFIGHNIDFLSIYNETDNTVYGAEQHEHGFYSVKIPINYDIKQTYRLRFLLRDQSNNKYTQHLEIKSSLNVEA